VLPAEGGQVREQFVADALAPLPQRPDGVLRASLVEGGGHMAGLGRPKARLVVARLFSSLALAISSLRAFVHERIASAGSVARRSNPQAKDSSSALRIVSCTVIIAVLLFAPGCRPVPKLTIAYHSTSRAAVFSGQANGLIVTVDPIVDPARSEEYFDTNALDSHLLPIHVEARNSNPNVSFLLQKKNISFFLGENTVAGAASTAPDVHSTAGDALVISGAILVSGPLLIAGILMTRNAGSVQHNFTTAELRDQTLSPGQTVSGFVYFQVPSAGLVLPGLVRVDAIDLESDAPTTIAIAVKSIPE
jgi:hypothetical protein